MTSHIEYNGKFYGYPDCCIKAFLPLVKFVFLSPERRAAAKQGFVPCQRCAERILKGELQIQDLISKRECSRPFIRV